MKRRSIANKAGMVLVVGLVLIGSVCASLSTLVSRGTEVLAYNDAYVHRFIAKEAVDVLPAGSKALQELETYPVDLPSGVELYMELRGADPWWLPPEGGFEFESYKDLLAYGAYHEDQWDHLYADQTGNLMAVRAIPHYWDADSGPEDRVKNLSGDPDVYPNANQKARDMFQAALDYYESGYFWLAYERLGHVAHLLADMTLPCHVHEDFHPGTALEYTDLQRFIYLGDPDSWEDDCYENWIYDSGTYQDYTAVSANIAGGMVTFPSEVITEAKWCLETAPDAAWKYLLYYLMYTAAQRADFFASDNFNGDADDPEGWMEGYWDWPTKYSKPRTNSHLVDNDHGLLGELTDDDNNEDGDLGVIAGECYVYGIRAIATLLQLFYECTHPIEPDLSVSYADQGGDGAADYRYVSLDVTYVGGDVEYREGLEVRFTNGDYSNDPIWEDPSDWRPVGAAPGGFRVPWVLSEGDGAKVVRSELRNLAGYGGWDAESVILAEIGVPQIFNYSINATGAGDGFYSSARVDFYVTKIGCGSSGDDEVEFYFDAQVDDGYFNTIPLGGQHHQEPSTRTAYVVPAGGWLDLTQLDDDDICWSRCLNCGWVKSDPPWDWSRVATVYVAPGQTVRLRTHGYDFDPWPNPDDDLDNVYTPIFTVPTVEGTHTLTDDYFQTRRNGELNEHYILRVRIVATVGVIDTWKNYELSDPDNPGWAQYGEGWQYVYTSGLEAPVPSTTTWEASVLDNPVVAVKMEESELWARVTGEPDTVIAGLSPVNLLVTDPDGFRVGTRTEYEMVWNPLLHEYMLSPVERSYAEIPGSSFIRQIDWDRDGDLENLDLDGDGDADTLIVIDSRKDGDYQIQATPAVGAEPTSTYSIAVATQRRPKRWIRVLPSGSLLVMELLIDRAWKTDFLVNSAPVSEMPSQAFVLPSGGLGFNLPPDADANGPYSALEGATVQMDASGSADPEGASLTCRWDFDSDGTWDTDWSSSPTASQTWYDDWSGQATVEVSDGTETATSTAVVRVYNEIPSVDSGPDQLAAPGDEVQFGGTFTDPGTGDIHTIHWDFGDGAEATGTLTPTHVYAQPGQYVVTITVTDDDGGVGMDTLKVNTGVEVSIDPLQAVVPPGHRFRYEVVVHNLRNVEDTYDVSLYGLESAWYSLSSSSVILNSGESACLTLEVFPPTAAEFGLYAFTILASSQPDPGVFDTADAQTQVATGEHLGLETTPPPAPTLTSPPHETVSNVDTIALDWTDVTDPSDPINYQVQVDNNDDFSSPEYDSCWVLASEATASALSDDTYFWRARASDGLGNVGEWSQVWQFLVDTIPPSVTIVSPPSGYALQDGITFVASATDTGSGVNSVTFSIREDDGGDGIPVGFEDMPGIYDSATGNWTLCFDTLQLPDGYYVVLVEATDNAGNTGSIIVPYSIRNWAVIELLPATENNNAGRTMPIKFSLRVCSAVDESQPFVYNEDLVIEIFPTDDPDEIMQISTFGDTSTDYRISLVGEQYITNFKTDKKATMYSVAIYRGTFLVTNDPEPGAIDSFRFETTKTKDKTVPLAAAAAMGGLLVLGTPSYFIGRRRKHTPHRDEVGCPHCGYPLIQSLRWRTYSEDGSLICSACYSPVDAE